MNHRTKEQELLEKIAEAEKELKALREEQKLPNNIKLATALHEIMCHYNHTDGCGWYYENWNVMGYIRMEYLKKANTILKVVDFETAMKVIDELY